MKTYFLNYIAKNSKVRSNKKFVIIIYLSSNAINIKPNYSKFNKFNIPKLKSF